MNLGTAFVEIRPDVDGFGRQLDQGVTTQAGTVGTTAGRRFSSSFRTALRGLGAAAIGAGLLTFLGGAVTQAEEAAATLRQTNAVIESTGGVANVTAGSLTDLADQLAAVAGVDDELVQSAGNVLLTFTNVRNELGEGNDVFDQALASALDLSAALGTDLQGATTLVGKALNDPLRGLTALTRAGVQFTDEQKRAIETALFFGDTLGAQKIILDELETQFGGSAEANATATGKWQVALEDFQETVGTTLLPALTDLIEKANELLGKFEEMDPATRNVILAVGAVAAVFLLLAIAIGGVAAAFVLVVGGLVGGIAYIVANIDVLREAWSGAWSFITTGLADLAGRTSWVGRVIDLVAQAGRNLWAVLTTVAAVTWAAILGQVQLLRAYISGAIGIGSALWGVLRGIAGVAMGAVVGQFGLLRGYISGVIGIAQQLLGVLRSIASIDVAAALGGLPAQILGGGRAMGGPVTRGVTLVGERGPELLFSDRAAYVASTQDTARMMRGDGGGGSVAPLVEEVRGLRRDVANLRLTVDTRQLALAVGAGNRPAERGTRGLRGNGL